MKILLCFLLLGFSSCINVTNIMWDDLTDRPKEVAMRGTFLLNILDIPISGKPNIKLTKITLKHLDGIWGDSVTYITSTPSPGIYLNPIPFTLDDTLRNSTDYNYLIHISATSTNNPDFNTMNDPLMGKIDLYDFATVGIIIFDIKNNIRVYDQAIRGTEYLEESKTTGIT
ncbi:MAG TPA: hypothetical protein VFE57_00750, partial [Cyclobacteriaceae bacterium]|nr:hypothetical protein [Cyclobacteriaceae bacterium]